MNVVGVEFSTSFEELYFNYNEIYISQYVSNLLKNRSEIKSSMAFELEHKKCDTNN